jgi:hypothetical protein
MNRTGDALGELGNVIRAGYRGVGLIGGSPDFPFGHARLDGAASVSGASLAPIVAAAAAQLRGIDRAAG